MPWEHEIKLRVADHEEVRSRLRACSASPLGVVMEWNVILDRPDGGLRASGCGLRIRRCESLDGPVQGSKRTAHSDMRSTLTFKGPMRAGPVKSREEWEIGVDDAETAEAILNGLGFARILAFEKRRESWQLGCCRVELDEPPHLGLFVEIEGPTIDDIRAAHAALGLSHVAHESSSYVRMLMEYCDRKGLRDRTLRFG